MSNSLLVVGVPPAFTHATLQAVEWLRCTYFYVRVKRNPAAYGMPRQPSIEALDRWLKDRLVLSTISELAQHGLVSGTRACASAGGLPSQEPKAWALNIPACTRLLLPQVVPSRFHRCRFACMRTALGWNRCSQGRWASFSARLSPAWPVYTHAERHMLRIGVAVHASMGQYPGLRSPPEGDGRAIHPHEDHGQPVQCPEGSSHPRSYRHPGRVSCWHGVAACLLVPA